MIDRFKRFVNERLGLDELRENSDVNAAGLDDLRGQVVDLSVQSSALSDQLQARLFELETANRIMATTAWAATAPLRHEPTISIVMATRNRSELVGAAIGSVLAQKYHRWQLVVVDDGSDDLTADLLVQIAADEPRLEVATTTGVGAAGARNAGLAAATGEWITFLDDDNTMAPGWLRAIAEYTGRAPDCESLYGAGLREDHLTPPEVPRILFEPSIDLDRLRHTNSIDLGVLAVKAAHSELHFDETLDRYIDWELAVRLAEHGALHPVPVLASAYTTRASGRISDPDDDGRLAAMQQRLGRSDSAP
jgi:glycosyltransferase involved in cell wall biosynthesis